MGQHEASRIVTDILGLLKCLSCSSGLCQRPEGLQCTSCGRIYPAIRGVVRFVEPDNYADSFGYQWTRFSKTQLKLPNADADFRRKTRLQPEDLKGKLVLDVGCGMGRFAEVATRWGARVVGVDLSAAAEVAAKNLANREFVALQADVFALPFTPEVFDVIYSMGVLHHTPDCEQAFKTLPQYLRPGGKIAIWVYSAYNKWYRFSDIYRKITHRMSSKALHRMLAVLVPFFYWLDRILRAIPGVGRPIAGVVHHVFPVNRSPNPQIRLLDTLDWYSPKYQSKHTYEQVSRWFESCGLEAIAVADNSIGMQGRKPLRDPEDQPASELSSAASGRAPMSSLL